jgi:MFS transporter, ACDE family, multidrug resistance protein
VTRDERLWLYLLATAASGLTLGLLAIIPAMPAIQKALGIPTADAGWFTTAYLIPTVVLTLPAGVLIARFNPNRLFAPVLIVYGLAGLVQPAMESYSAILVFRGLQGVCVAVAMPMTITMIANIFEGGRQIRALSVRQIVLTLSGMIWPPVGATMAAVAWQAPFLIQGLVIPVALMLMVHSPPSGRAPVMGGHARRLKMLRTDPVAASVLLLNFSRYFFLFVVVVYLPVLVVTREGYSLTQAGLMIAAVSAVSAIASGQMERMVARVQPGGLALAACTLVGGGLIGLGVTAQWGWTALAACIAFGVGDGIWGVLGDSYVARLWEGDARSAMAAVIQTFRNAGKLAGPLAVTALLVVGALPVSMVVVGAAAWAVLFGLLPLRTLDTPAGWQVQKPRNVNQTT